MAPSIIDKKLFGIKDMTVQDFLAISHDQTGKILYHVGSQSSGYEFFSGLFGSNLSVSIPGIFSIVVQYTDTSDTTKEITIPSVSYVANLRQVIGTAFDSVTDATPSEFCTSTSIDDVIGTSDTATEYKKYYLVPVSTSSPYVSGVAYKKVGNWMYIGKTSSFYKLPNYGYRAITESDTQRWIDEESYPAYTSGGSALNVSDITTSNGFVMNESYSYYMAYDLINGKEVIFTS